MFETIDELHMGATLTLTMLNLNLTLESVILYLNTLKQETNKNRP